MQSMIHSCEKSNVQLLLDNPSEAIAAYYTARIAPWHKAARQAVTEFNLKYPDHRLKESFCEKFDSLKFQSTKSKDVELKISPQSFMDGFRAKLKDPTLPSKEHIALLPETFYTQICNMLMNHVGQTEI